MRYRIMFVICIVFFAMFLQGCFFYNPNALPEYERELNEQDGVAVTVDGVRYVALPALKWRNQKSGETFGQAGGKTVSYCKNDPEQNFIFIWDKEYQPLSELHDVLLYRTDKVIPPPSAESVDEFYWSEINFRGPKAVRRSKLIDDKEVIKAIFDELDANQDTWITEPDSIVEYSMSISCLSSTVQGARYDLYFEHVDGKLVCGNYFDGYVEFSPEVLAQIAGHEIDLEWLIAWE